MLCRLRDQRSHAFNVGFWPCPLHAEISPDSLCLLMILWTVDGEITKFLAISRWETLFLNCWTICPRSCSQCGEPRPILACERLSPSWMLFLNPIITRTCFQLSHLPVKCSEQVFYFAILNFPSLLLTLSELFWNLLQALISEFVYICTKTINFFNFNMKYLVFVLYSIEYRSKKALLIITLCFI